MRPDSSHDAWQSRESGNFPPGVMREDQITQAMRFLADPRTQTASHEQKQDFLRNKGLSDAEVDAAFSRYQASTQTNKPQPINQPIYVRPAFMDEPILWSAIKSIFSAVGAMAIGVLGYHAFLSNDQLEKESTISTPLNTEAGLTSANGRTVSEERLLEAMSELSVKQELRHKELLLSIRELSNSLTSTSIARKPGGAIVLPATSRIEANGDKGVPRDWKRVEEQETSHDSAQEKALDHEPLNIEAEVQSAIEQGVDGTLLLILSSPENNRKLNKSNPRFKKLEGNRLVAYAGYADTGEFLELLANRDDQLKINSQTIIEEIRRARKKHSNDQPSFGRSPVGEGFHSAPWQAGFPITRKDGPEETKADFCEMETLLPEGERPGYD